MRWMMLALVCLAAAMILGCGTNETNPTPPPGNPVGSYLGDAFLEVGTPPAPQLVANIGLVVREDGTVQGAFFTGQDPVAPGSTPNYDAAISGTWSAAGLNASGVLIGPQGVGEAGTVTLSGAFSDVSYVGGTFTATDIGTGIWRCFLFTTPPLGCYAGAYNGSRQGEVVIMNFLVEDCVIVVRERDLPQSDFFAGQTILSLPTEPGGSYGLLADESWYNTGLVISGAVGQLTGAGLWEQPSEDSTLAGQWTATRPPSVAGAAARSLVGEVPRVRRVRR